MNILGIILGVIAGGGSDTVLLATGFAAAITESISMGCGRIHLRNVRARLLRGRDGARGEGDRRGAGRRTAGDPPDLCGQGVLRRAARECRGHDHGGPELHLQPKVTGDIIRTAVVITVTTLIGHLIPLLPFVVLSRTPALVAAIALSALSLFAVGVYSALTLVGNLWTNGLKMVTIGLGAAALGFVVGRLFNATGV